MVLRHRLLPNPIGDYPTLLFVTNSYSCLIVLTLSYSYLLDVCIHDCIKLKVVSYVIKRLPTSLGGCLQ